MQKSFRLLAAAVLIALAIWGWRALFSSPEKAIRSRLTKLAATISFAPKDGEVSKGLKAQSVRDFFTEDASFALDLRGYGVHNLDGRDDLQQTALGLMHNIRGLKVELLDVHVTVAPDKQTAVANLTGKATVSGESDFYVQEMNFRLRKVEGKWLIHAVETVKTLNENQFSRARAG